jgi:hypothetical protein
MTACTNGSPAEDTLVDEVQQLRTPIEGKTKAPEFISVPEWCKRVGCSLDAGYRAARRNEIARLFRIGKLMRINWEAFVAATYR